jgi:hypothetical protein
MKGTVQRRWKLTEKGTPADCKHGGKQNGAWIAEDKDGQRCALCGARRMHAATWTWQHEGIRNGKRVFLTGTCRTKVEAQKALTASLSTHEKGEQIDK